ncbi:hypothetical protein AKJ58_00335 [candidate division MSBL1 archaeon SCGC-AAA385D11]|uniref:Uncharacterized protein n=1 Tax=candidate division MSBL1 archaeon SCGC-AAA385D11 TaxID=1698286 RepID=A0A133VPC2_9EURY|nr:hypothetical protein AKJ58_00335 [candidate division MSBL1 archaeon SCGC-AAA385D11]
MSPIEEERILEYQASVDIVKEAVRACYQEEPTRFKDYELRDPGAFHELPICREISMRVEQPWAHTESEENHEKIKRIKEKINKKGKKRR